MADRGFHSKTKRHDTTLLLFQTFLTPNQSTRQMLTTAPQRAHQGQAAEDKTIPRHAILLLFQTFSHTKPKHTPNVNDSPGTCPPGTGR